MTLHVTLPDLGCSIQSSASKENIFLINFPRLSMTHEGTTAAILSYKINSYNFQCYLEVISEKTKEVLQLAEATYAHNLVIKSTHVYKVHGPYGSFPCECMTMTSMWIHRCPDYIVSWIFFTSLFSQTVPLKSKVRNGPDMLNLAIFILGHENLTCQHKPVRDKSCFKVILKG